MKLLTLLVGLCVLLVSSSINHVSGAIGFERGVQDNLPDQIDKVRSSVVAVSVEIDPREYLDRLPSTYKDKFSIVQRTFILGTGYFVNEKADTVTALHVARDARKILSDLEAAQIKAELVVQLETPDYFGKSGEMRRNWRIFAADISAENPEHDIAVLSVHGNVFQQASQPFFSNPDPNGPKPHASFVEFDTSQPREGTPVFVCGYPIGASELTTTSGHVANAWATKILETTKINHLSNPTDVFQLDLLATFGNSGGPAFFTSNAGVMGMDVELTSLAPTPRAVVVPARYVTQLLTTRNVPWTSSSTVHRGH